MVALVFGKGQHNHHTPHKGRGGFSLLELMVVMIMLVVITTAIIPLYSATMNALQLRNSRSDITGLLGAVQERAVSESREYRIYFNEENSTYWVAALSGYEDGEKVFEKSDERFSQEQRLPKNITISDIKAHKDRNVKNTHHVACYPNGASDRAQITIQNGSSGAKVEILLEGVSGAITVTAEKQ